MNQSSTSESKSVSTGMKISWWKIATVILLMYSVIAGFWIALIPSITGVSNSTLEETKPVYAYVYNGKLKSSSHVQVWVTNMKINWKASNVKVESDQKLALTFTNSPFIESENVHLIVETNNYRDTLFNAFYHKLAENAPEGVIALEKIEYKKDLQKIFGFPNREILNETIRNLFFHVPIWFAMMLVAGIGLFNGFQYLRKGNMDFDLKAEKYLKTTVFMGFLGLLTGSIWARFTWGNWWAFDVKLNGAAITVLIYIAYLVLRSGITDEIQRAKISAVYSIFAFVMMVLFVLIVPRIYDSLHPGNGGNAPVSDYDFDSTLRMVFYPAVLGWMGLSLWITQLSIRIQRLKNKHDETV